MAEETKVKMRYRGPAVANPDMGPLEDNKVYEVGEPLARRLLISHGWKPSGEEAQAWAEKQAEAQASASAASAEDAGVSGQEAADSGHQEAQDNLGDAQHEDEGDPENTDGEKGAGSALEPGAGVPDEEAPAESRDTDNDGEDS